MARKILTHIAFLLTASLVMFGCKGNPRVGEAENEPVAAVRVFKAEKQTSAASERVPGTIRPKLRAVIEAKLSGRVDKVLVTEGQKVEQGEPLADIDAKEIKAKLDQALAMKEQAERDLERFKALIAQKAVTQSEFDGAQARARVARGAVEEGQAMLAYTHVTAPFAGVITRKLTDIGDLAAPGKPLFQMEDPNTLRFEAGVPESVMANIAVGESLPIELSNIEQPIEGRVAEISPVADQTSRTYLVKLDLPNVPALRSGQFGHVAVPLQGEMSLSIPASALVQRGQMEIVFVVDNEQPRQRALLRLVRSGKKLGEQVEILAGLAPGDEVVVDKAASLRDGQRVEAQQ